MVPLKLNRQLLMLYCALPAEGVSVWKKLLFILYTIFALVAMSSMLISSGVFFVRNITVNLEASLHALFPVSLLTGQIYVVVVAFLLRNEINQVLNKLSNIYDMHEKGDSYSFLLAANKKSDSMCKAYIKYAIGGFVINGVTMSTLSVLAIFLKKGEFHAKHAYHPNKLDLPWNLETLFGYFGEIYFTIGCESNYLLAKGAVMTLFASICVHHVAFLEILRHSLQKLDQSDKKRYNKRILCEIVEFHNMVKSLFLESAEVYSHIILIQIVTSMVSSSCCVFGLDLAIKHHDSNASQFITVLTIAVCMFFAWCYFGKLATDSFLKMPDCMFECNWLLLPVELQKYFIIMIKNAQRPLYYHGFKIMVLDLDVFLKIMKTIFTYYMMFKTLTE